MDCRTYISIVCLRRSCAVAVSMRLIGVVAILMAGLSTGGCMASQMKASSHRPVEAGMEVFVQASIEQHTMDTACLFLFNSPPEMAAASSSITTAFQSRLIQRRPFREIRQLPMEVKSDSEALWHARNEGCSLAMLPSIVYMMDGTGAMPTELVVRVRILDARTGGVLWDVKQNGRSEPGYDIDLDWNTVSGEPAQRCRVLADCLAQRFATFLLHPMDKEN